MVTWPGQGGAWPVGQVWCRTGCCPNIYIYSRQCSDTHQHDRVESREYVTRDTPRLHTVAFSRSPPVPSPSPRPGHQRGRLQTVVSSECGHWVCAAQPSLHVSPQLRRCHNKTDNFSCDTIRFLSEAVNQAE